MRSLKLIGDIGGDGEGGWFRDAGDRPRYRAQPGDTYFNLAARYLGSERAAGGLFALNDEGRGGNVNHLRAGDVLRFPREGEETATALGLLEGGQIGDIMGHYDANGVYTLDEVVIEGYGADDPRSTQYLGEADDWDAGKAPIPSPLPTVPIDHASSDDVKVAKAILDHDTQKTALRIGGAVAGAGVVALAWHWWKTRKPARRTAAA